MKDKGFVVSVGPHIQGRESIPRIVYGVVIAILPAIIAGVYFFKMEAVKVIVAALVSAIVFDALLQKLICKKVDLTNGHALLMGLLFATIMPIGVPWWAVAAGVFVGLLVGEYVYGGFGNNPFNPVIVGWAALKLSYPGYLSVASSVLGVLKLEGISAIVEDYGYFSDAYGVENWSTLGGKLKLLGKILLGWKAGAWGDHLFGCVGCICALAILIGAAFLFIKRYISWYAPVGFLATILFFSLVFYKGDKQYLYPFVLIQLFSGSTLLAAFFFVTDFATTPFTGLGMFIFGVMAGLVTMLGRLWGKWVDPVWFAILVANAFTPLIDRFVRPKPFGRVKSSV